ncbi:DsbA family protein [Deinococcus actinosclerus]|uniref:DsbA family protein n=1 Tax=Deinococcus actinosclerus TaxID=1768108 RepID=UPI000A9DCC8E|nr:DsbA family protein [Deinococcus actinosclerus]
MSIPRPVRLLPVLVASVLVSSAGAQLLGTPAQTLAQPVLKGMAVSGNVARQGTTTITLDTAGGYVVGVLTDAASLDDLARGVGAGWGLDAANLPKLKGNLSNPQLLTAARAGFVDLTDDAGTDLIALKVTGEGSATRYQAYVAVNIWPDSAFPATKAVTGTATAPVTLRVFSDFQCPYCKQMWDTAMPAWRKDSATYRVMHYEFPLSFHRNAQGAAEASECALAQGKFWPFADQLFANYQSWTPLDPKDAPAKYAGYAKAAGLDTAAFKACVGQRTFRSSVEAQVQAGLKVNVQGTPTVYLNGLKLSNYADAQEVARARAVTTAQPSAASLIEERLKLFR